MTFDEVVEVVKGLEGKHIEVSVNLPSFEEDFYELVGFSGAVTRVGLGLGEQARVRPWRIWLDEDEERSMPGVVSLDPRLFVSATFEADREEADYTEGEYDSEQRTGMTWTPRLNQANVMVEIIIFV
jgi:hypothetical protein